MRKKVLLKTLATATMAITLSACTMEKADTNPSTQETEANISTTVETVSEESSSEVESAVISTQEAESESGEESDTGTAALPEDERLLKLSANKSLSENEKIDQWYCADYDNDGKKEAFCKITSEDKPSHLLFVSSEGVDYWPNYWFDDSDIEEPKLITTDDNHIYFTYGYDPEYNICTTIMGVKDGDCYELDLSLYNHSYGIYQDEDGTIWTRPDAENTTDKIILSSEDGQLTAPEFETENALREKAIATINEDPALPELDEKVPFVFFHYEDYDGDGTKEAFAGTSECVLFISSDGSVSNAKEIYDYYQYDDILPAPDGRFFLQYALGTGAENTYIALGVKNGKPYELNLSGYCGYGSISLQKDGSYTTYTGNYLETEPNIHEYPLSYKDGEFIPPAEFYFDYKGTVLKRYNGSDENVIIPKKCEDGTVFTEIDTSTYDFFSLYWVGDEHPNFKSIEIPSTITKIGAASVGYFDGKKIDGFIIKCEKGSEAERYAKDNGFAVEYMK